MSKKEENLIIIVNAVIMSIMLVGTTFLLRNLEWYLKIIAYFCIGLFGLGTFIYLFKNKYKLAKSFFMFNLTTFIIVVFFLILNISGVFESLSDMEYIKSLILNSGILGVAVCFILQVLMVVILPIPGFIFILAVTSVYGPLITFIIIYIATVVGSIIAFWIGRFFGQKAVSWCIGKEDMEKYSTLLNEKGKIPFVIMQILPFFPDDILCMVAGLSNMKYRFFIIVMLIVRPIYIGFVCFFGTGNIIPFYGWGLVVWVIIFAVFISVCVLYFRNQEKIDAFLIKKFSKNWIIVWWHFLVINILFFKYLILLQ